MILPLRHEPGLVLGDALREVVDLLEVCACSGRPAERMVQLNEAAERFRTEFEAALQEQAAEVLPALRRRIPEREAAELQRVSEEHRALRNQAERLLDEVRSEDLLRAWDSARDFLEALIRHVRRQEALEARARPKG